jgi:hypothetical protein
MNTRKVLAAAVAAMLAVAACGGAGDEGGDTY